ncbi:MAG: Holliday junction branch migration protein RuvA [Candidatus Sungbacteria bacterium]|nr:Holliday junction branch migration protein RuvA [Candidatus Sungbacteria bacterium]
MIGSLEGTIEFVAEKFILLDVYGVGYKIFCGAGTLDKMPEKGATVKLWIHYHVREDSHELYGFLHYAELDLFELLIGISGIGPKGALGVLNIAPVDTLKKAIAAGDTSYLTRVSGIGRKTAEKVVLELREKMSGRGVSVDAPELRHEADALEALMGLGYSQREAREALAGTPTDAQGNRNGVGSVEERVKCALRKLGKK